MTKCWDCGSTLPRRHTPLCAMAGDDETRDLPQVPHTQWWDGTLPGDVQLYAVRYNPSDGPHSVFLVEGTTVEDAGMIVLDHLHRIDMDMVTLSDLTVIRIGPTTDEIYTAVRDGMQLKEVQL